MFHTFELAVESRLEHSMELTMFVILLYIRQVNNLNEKILRSLCLNSKSQLVGCLCL